MPQISHLKLKKVLWISLLSICLVGIALLGPPHFHAQAASSNASIILSPISGPPTTSVTVQGTGFGVKENVDITFDTTPVGTAKTNKNGTFTSQFTVPASALPGQHTVQAICQKSGLSAQASFLVQTDWSMFGFYAPHTSYNPFENVLSPSNVSKLTLDWSLKGSSYAYSPTVASGLIYVDTKGKYMSALDAQTGAFQWKFKRIYVASSPAAANGMIYTDAPIGEVDALDAQTGALKWYYRAGSTITDSPPTIANGIIYVGSDNGSVYALDALTGALIWKQPFSITWG